MLVHQRVTGNFVEKVWAMGGDLFLRSHLCLFQSVSQPWKQRKHCLFCWKFIQLFRHPLVKSINFNAIPFQFQIKFNFKFNSIPFPFQLNFKSINSIMCDQPFGETSGQVKIRILKFMGATKFAVHFSGPISSSKSQKQII